MPTMQQPEVYIAKVNEVFDENGFLKDESSKGFLQKAVDAYLEWFNENVNNQ